MKNCFYSIPRLIAVIMPFIFLAFLAEFFSISNVEASENFPYYNLSVSFDIKDNLIKGISTVTLTEGKEMSISTGMLKIMSVKLNGQPFDPEIRNGVFRVDVKGTLEIAYEGVFKEENIKENPENAGVVSRNIVSEEGIYLAGGWYPSIEGMVYYSLKAVIPEGLVAISEADEINVRETALGNEYYFNFPHPVNNINLVAGKYTELKETFNNINICGYFFSDDVKLA